MYKAFFENNYQYFLYGYDSQNQDSGILYNSPQINQKFSQDFNYFFCNESNKEDDEFNRCVEMFKDSIGLPENDN